MHPVRIRWAGCVAHMGRREANTWFWYGRTRHRWEDNIKMDFKEVG